jgi:hypothetical protein
MKTPEYVAWHIKQVQWAVRLSQTDLTALRVGDWQNLKEELWEFITGPARWTGMMVLPSGRSKEDYLDELSSGTMAEIQKSLKGDLLRYSADDKQNGFGLTLRPRSIEFDFVAFGRDAYYTMLLQAGDAVTDARLSLGFHLVGGVISPSSIRSCPQCVRLFVRERKLREDISNHYCSTRCARNAAAQAYRNRQGEKLKASERDRSHQRYVNHAQQTVGPNVKVKRRARASK